jgi:hypothetical protein
MADWFLVPCLVELRSEFNDLSPKRDKGADGSIGDTAHQAEPTSDHNPDLKGRVKALDIDSTGPWPGFTFDQAVQLVIARCRSGAEDRIEYIIWNRKIYSRSYGYATRAYTGTADPHTNHAHFSARHDHHGESDTRGWNLLSLEDPMAAITIADITAASEQGFRNALASGFLAKDQAGRNLRDQLRGIVGGPSDAGLAAMKDEILAAITAGGGVTLSEAQVKAIGDAVGNAANTILMRVITKLEHAGAALTQ